MMRLSTRRTARRAVPPLQRLLPPLALLLCLPVVGCDSTEPIDEIPTLTMDSVSLRIGLAEGAEQYLFQRIHSVVLTTDGGIVVGDQAPRVALFDREGSWVSDLARRGSGPGELQLVGGLWSGAADTTVVWDARQRKLVLIPSSGTVRELPLAWGPTARPVDGVPGRVVLELETGQLMDTAQAVSRLVAHSDQDPITVAGPYPVPEIGWKVTPDGVGQMVNAPIFEPYPAWDVSSAGLWWTDGTSSSLSLFDWSGTRIEEIDLPLSDRRVSESDLETYYAGMMGRWGADMRPENGQDPATATSTPLVTRIVADDRGCVWLADFDPGADFSRNWSGPNYLVVSRHTRAASVRVRFPSGFTLTDVRGGIAAGVWEDSHGLQFVHLYEIQGEPFINDCVESEV